MTKLIMSVDEHHDRDSTTKVVLSQGLVETDHNNQTLSIEKYGTRRTK